MRSLILSAFLLFSSCKTISIGIGEISAFGFSIRNITISPKSAKTKIFPVIGTGNSKEIAKKDCYFDAIRKFNVSVDTVYLDSMQIKTSLFSTKYQYYGTGIKFN